MCVEKAESGLSAVAQGPGQVLGSANHRFDKSLRPRDSVCSRRKEGGKREENIAEEKAQRRTLGKKRKKAGRRDK